MKRIRGDRQLDRQAPRLLQASAATGIVLLVALSSFRAAAGTPTEYQVKAAYLSNFGRFVEWPSKADVKPPSFAICVLGTDPFGRALDQAAAGQSIDGMSVIARRLSTPEQAAGCRVLFISTSESDSLPEVLSALSSAGVLTVSDLPQFTERGGMIGFTLQENRVRFEVNLTAAKSAGLALSSQLLKLAASVKGPA